MFHYACYAFLMITKQGNFMLKFCFVLFSFVSFTTFESQLKALRINIHWNQHQSGGTGQGSGNKKTHLSSWNIFQGAMLWLNHRETQSINICMEHKCYLYQSSRHPYNQMLSCNIKVKNPFKFSNWPASSVTSPAEFTSTPNSQG